MTEAQVNLKPWLLSGDARAAVEQVADKRNLLAKSLKQTQGIVDVEFAAFKDRFEAQIERLSTQVPAQATLQQQGHERQVLFAQTYADIMEQVERNGLKEEDRLPAVCPSLFLPPGSKME